MIKIFWSPTCPNCPKAKELGEIIVQSWIKVEYFNIAELDGRTEAVFNDVLTTPSVMIKDRKWLGMVPTMEEIGECLNTPKTD